MTYRSIIAAEPEQGMIGAITSRHNPGDIVQLLILGIGKV